MNVFVKSINGGAVGVWIGPPQSPNVASQIYSNTSAARDVLLGLGLDEQEIDAVLNLLGQLEQGKPLQFSTRIIGQKVLWANGFRL